MAGGDVEIRIVGHDEASGAINSIKGALGGMMEVAGGLLAAEGIKALVDGLKDSMKAAQESQIIEAQTAAVIKSTGDASGMSATQIKSYATALEGTSTFSRDTIQQGENMLLTFTSIGKSTFPTATQAVTDMTASFQAAGKGMNISDIAIMVGKALNDPVKGMTALHRVGVAFTEDQKKTVEQLMKTGDVAGAQAVILKELNTEFGGSAAAQAGTYAGQLAIVRNRFQDMKIAVGEALMPVLATLASAVLPLVSAAFEKIPALIERITPTLQNMAAIAVSAFRTGFGFVTSTVVPAVERLATTLQGPVHAAFVLVRDAVLTFVQALSGNWTDSSKIEGLHRVIGQVGLTIHSQVIPAVQLLAQLFTTYLLPVIQSLAEFIGAHLNVVLPIVGALLLAWLGPLAIITTAVGALLIAWRTNFLGIQDIVSAVWGVIGPVLDAIKTNLETFGSETLPKLIAAWQSVRDKVEEVVRAIKPIVEDVFNAIASFISDHGTQIKAILTGAWDIIKGVIQVDVALIEGIIKVALDLISGNWYGAWNDIKATAQGVWAGIQSIIQGAVQIVQNEIQIALDAIKAIWSAMWNGLSAVVSAAWAAVMSAIDSGIAAIKGAFSGAAGWLVQAGSNLVMGLVNGIRGAIGAAASEAANLAKSVLNAAKSALGISSPSKAMHEVGTQIVDGLNQGISDKSKTYDWKSLFSGIPDAAQATATDIAKALDDGVTAGALTAGQAAMHITTGVLEQLGSLYTKLQVQIDNLALSGSKTAGTQIAALQAQMAAIQGIMEAWSKSTGLTIADGLKIDQHAGDVVKGWKDLVSQISGVFDGTLIPKLQTDLDHINALLTAAIGEHAPQDIIDSLTTQLNAKSTELEQAGKMMADAIAKGIIEDPAIKAAAKQTADMFNTILSSTDPKKTVDDYQAKAKLAAEAYQMGLEEKLPAAEIAALKDAADKAKQQATEAGTVLAQATADGFIAVTQPFLKSQNDSLIAYISKAKDAGVSMVGDIVSAVQSGRMTMTMAARDFTQPMVDKLKELQQQAGEQLQQAFLKGTDPTQIVANLKAIGDMLDKVTSSINAGMVALGKGLSGSAPGQTGGGIGAGTGTGTGGGGTIGGGTGLQPNASPGAGNYQAGQLESRLIDLLGVIGTMVNGSNLYNIGWNAQTGGAFGPGLTVPWALYTNILDQTLTQLMPYARQQFGDAAKSWEANMIAAYTNFAHGPGGLAWAPIFTANGVQLADFARGGEFAPGGPGTPIPVQNTASGVGAIPGMKIIGKGPSGYIWGVPTTQAEMDFSPNGPQTSMGGGSMFSGTLVQAWQSMLVPALNALTPAVQALNTTLTATQTSLGVPQIHVYLNGREVNSSLQQVQLTMQQSRVAPGIGSI